MPAKITPAQLAAPGTEHAHQTAFFATFTPEYCPDDLRKHAHLLVHMFAIPSGGARDVVTAGRLKAEGVKPGVPDVCLPVKNGMTISPTPLWHCLWLEFKRVERRGAAGGGLSSAQIDMKKFLESQGHCVVPTYGYLHGIEIVRWYLG